MSVKERREAAYEQQLNSNREVPGSKSYSYLVSSRVEEGFSPMCTSRWEQGSGE